MRWNVLTRARRLALGAVERVSRTPAGRMLVSLGQNAVEDDIGGMAAEMAYRFLFALVPAILLIVTVVGFVGELVGLERLVRQMLEQFRPLVPAPVFETLQDVAARMLSERSGAFLTLGLIGAVWGTAAGVGTLIKGLNRAYGVRQPRPVWRRQALGIGAALSLPLVAVASLLIVNLGETFARAIASVLGLDVGAIPLVGLMQLLVIGALFFLAMSTIYHRLPNVRIRYRNALPGTFVVVPGVMLLAEAVAFYVRLTESAAAAYTGFGAAFIFLLWLYLVSLLILVGAGINAMASGARRRT